MKKVAIFFIKSYKVLISPILGTKCRFYPSCSDYAMESIEKKGVIKGGFRSLIRLLKCQPFHSGGYDPVRE